ncbi:hypothetical protein PC117_g26850 [Phytophthora cactorum]|uniref:Uncharacterized protein n=1 Tax=Phytophthora cactorum TaxID=29920 RepID=A0A8T1AF55_9STRA|nr:hypothetical protein PC117_g26850 [Phytophthora cactorum]
MAPPKPAGEGDGSTPIAPPSSGQPGSPASSEDPRTSVGRLSTWLHSLIAQLQDSTTTREGVRTEHGKTRRGLRDPTGIQPADQIRILRQQIHDQAMEIQGWEHTTDSRDRDLRRQLADQARQIYDLESLLDHVFLQRDHLRQSNDHLFQEMRLAGSEIDELHTRIWDQERELADAVAANTVSEESLQRLQEELRHIGIGDQLPYRRGRAARTLPGSVSPVRDQTPDGIVGGDPQISLLSAQDRQVSVAGRFQQKNMGIAAATQEPNGRRSS